MLNEWFQTWDRPEYLEWAKPIPEGYLLHIIRKESENFLLVRAKLIMKEKGLPDFEIVEQCYEPTQEDALQQIKTWETTTGE